MLSHLQSVFQLRHRPDAGYFYLRSLEIFTQFRLGRGIFLRFRDGFFVRHLRYFRQESSDASSALTKMLSDSEKICGIAVADMAATVTRATPAALPFTIRDFTILPHSVASPVYGFEITIVTTGNDFIRTVVTTATLATCINTNHTHVIITTRLKSSASLQCQRFINLLHSDCHDA